MTQISFNFDAIDRRGERTSGVICASSRRDAYQQVRAVGLQPLRLRATRRGRATGRRITARDLALFTQEFEVLMKARLPIVDGLRAIAEQEVNPRFRMVIDDVAQNVAAGNHLSDALEKHREVFGEVYVQTMRAAERTGNMNEVLANLSEMLEREYEMRKQIKSAMIYPACVLGWLALAVGFLLIVIVPRFASMFAERGVELPLPTKVILGFGNLLSSWWPLVLGLLAISCFAAHRAWKSDVYRERIDHVLHRIPVLREILRGVAVGRFAQVLGLCIRSGLSLIEALDMAGQASGRPMLIADGHRLAEQVKQGGRLSEVLMACSYLPPLARRMLTAGEEAAELPRMCAIVAGRSQREVAHLAKTVSDLIEPLLIVLLAGVVLIVALAIFLPMWNMAALIS